LGGQNSYKGGIYAVISLNFFVRSVVQPGSIDSNLCFICKENSFKRDFKLHKIESSERLDSLMSRAKEHNDLMMLKTLNKPDFLLSCVQKGHH
jgi:hypothetical protein